MDESDFKLDESAADAQRHIDATTAELLHHIDATFTGMDRHLEAGFAEIRRHFEETAEGLRRHFDLLEERVVSLDQNLDCSMSEIRAEMRDGFAETWAVLKSFQRPEVSRE